MAVTSHRISPLVLPHIHVIVTLPPTLDVLLDTLTMGMVANMGSNLITSSSAMVIVLNSLPSTNNNQST